MRGFSIIGGPLDGAFISNVGDRFGLTFKGVGFEYTRNEEKEYVYAPIMGPRESAARVVDEHRRHHLSVLDECGAEFYGDAGPYERKQIRAEFRSTRRWLQVARRAHAEEYRRFREKCEQEQSF